MLTEKEKSLITELRKNSRANITYLAKKLNYPVSTLYDVLYRLESKGVMRYTSQIMFEKIGFPIQQIIFAKSINGYGDTLRKYMENKSQVNVLKSLSRSYYYAECIFRSQREAELFQEELEKENMLSELNTYNVMENIHSEKFLEKKEHFMD